MAPRKPPLTKPKVNLDSPEVEEIVNGTKDSVPEPAPEPEPKEDPQEAARKALEAREAEERALERKIKRRDCKWLLPGTDNAPRQTNVALPNKLKLKMDYILFNMDSKTTITAVVTDLLEKWARDKLEEMNVDSE